MKRTNDDDDGSSNNVDNGSGGGETKQEEPPQKKQQKEQQKSQEKLIVIGDRKFQAPKTVKSVIIRLFGDENAFSTGTLKNVASGVELFGDDMLTAGSYVFVKAIPFALHIQQLQQQQQQQLHSSFQTPIKPVVQSSPLIPNQMNSTTTASSSTPVFTSPTAENPSLNQNQNVEIMLEDSFSSVGNASHQMNSKSPQEEEEEEEEEELSVALGSPNLTKREGFEMLEQWLGTHIDNPYPTSEEIYELIKQTGLALTQIQNWFANAKRLLISKQFDGKWDLTSCARNRHPILTKFAEETLKTLKSSTITASNQQNLHPTSSQPVVILTKTSDIPIISEKPQQQQEFSDETLKLSTNSTTNNQIRYSQPVILLKNPTKNPIPIGVPLTIFRKPKPHAKENPRLLPRKAVEILETYLGKHLDNPYVANEEQNELAKLTGVHKNRIRNWFANSRATLIKKRIRDGKWELTNLSRSSHPILCQVADESNQNQQTKTSTTATTTTNIPIKTETNPSIAEPIALEPILIAESSTPHKNPKRLTKKVVAVFQAWLGSHLQNPYPTGEEIKEIIIKSGEDYKKVQNWFANARRNIIKEKGDGSWVLTDLARKKYKILAQLAEGTNSTPTSTSKEEMESTTTTDDDDDDDDDDSATDDDNTATDDSSGTD